jgi:exopolysaccharide biosynthesis polyprenyl glycosylphosphotransferase
VRTSDNLRAHFLKAGIRLVGLVIVDLSAITIAATILRLVRAGGAGSALASMVVALFPAGVISQIEVSAAIVLALFFMECYRADDRWKDPVGIITSVGMGILLTLYGDLWRSDPGLVAVRGLVVWVLLAPCIVLMRKLASVVVGIGHHRALQHRVLLIQDRESKSVPIDLGAGYRLHATMETEEVPARSDALERWLEQGVDTILVLGEVPTGEFTRIADFALTHGCRLLSVPRSTELVGVEPRTVWHGGRPYLELTTPGLRATHLLVKRIFDIVVSGVLILLLSPVMAAVALAVWLESPGPVFFRQKRAGHRGRFFFLLKFRSMRPDAEARLRAEPALWSRYVANNFKLPEEEDPRITKLGRILRKTSLDELPQLLNVFRGDMSLVGPRPVVEPELEMYQGNVLTFLSVKPGMTGLWQISGRSRVGFPQRAEIDLEYVRRWSLLGDLWILALTIPAVLARKGAH